MKTILVLFLLYGFVHGKARVDTLVSTNLGQIRGVRLEDANVTQFLGVPYALVNETNPFGSALPYPVFEDIYEANDNSTMCIQSNSNGGTTGTIQCLQLHIHVPDTASTENLLPVMVWIHGGGFSSGSGGADYPQTLVQKDVIVVTINYRLGIYGFLCLDTPEVPGNQGFKDQMLALKWVKENIEAFGGDPTNVTPFGQSAGGMSVNAHLYSDGEKLFDKIIVESGPALSVWFFLPSNRDAPFKLAEYLGYNTTDINDAVSYLSTVEPSVVVAAATDTGLISSSTDESKVKPCIEKKFDGVENFISEHPVNVKVAPKVNSTPILIGYNNEEMGLGFSAISSDGINYDNFEYMLSFGFPLNDTLAGILQLVKNFYVGDEKEFGVSVKKQVVDYSDDLVFSHPTQRMVEQFIDNGAKAVYRYVFSYTSDKNATGAYHGAELAYLFELNQFVTATEKTEREQLLFEQMTTMWSNFAKYGNPTPEVTDLLPVEWKPATKEEQFSLDINTEFILRSRPDYERMTFWDLFYRAYEKYQYAYNEDS